MFKFVVIQKSVAIAKRRKTLATLPMTPETVLNFNVMIQSVTKSMKKIIFAFYYLRSLRLTGY